MTTAISSLVVECLKLFRNVPIADIERGRFETWSGNVGAHQKGRSSLDSRLADAPHVSGVVVDFLDELKDALSEAKNTEHQESTNTPAGSNSDSDSSTDDEAFNFFFNKQGSSSEQLLSTIKSIISSLLQLTVTLRRPAHLDRYIKAKNIDVSYHERTDRDHVQNLFPKISGFLTIRAVNATLSRRRFLKYSELHSQKLAEGLESCNEPDEVVFSDTTASLAPRDITTPNVSKPSRLEEEADLMSMTSHATSGVSMANSDRPHVPPPPADAELDGNPFVCPYCHNLINPDSRNQWKRHVYSDLRPYHCTFEICDNPDYLFQNRHNWFEHELRVHRRTYSCLYDCDLTLDSYEALKNHVRSAHGNLLEQSPDLLEMSANGRQLGSAAAAKCPFCGDMLSNRKLIRSHIGRHQSRLALWALPRSLEREGSENGEDSEDQEDGADEENLRDIEDEKEVEDMEEWAEWEEDRVNPLESDPILPSLPKELAPILNKIAGKPVVITTSASNSIAKDNAVQVCGPVAGSIQYIFNLSAHYNAGEIDTCWLLTGGSGAVEISTSKPPSEDPKLQDNQRLAAQAPYTQQLHLHRPGKGTMPVLATFDPNTEGNWIAARIVSRMKFEHQVASIHKDVPAIMGQSFGRTRIFVDLTCSKQGGGHRCQHRFYVVNHCRVFDILLGTKLYPSQGSNLAS